MQFQILGQLDVRREGGPVALGAAKQRTLLAILLVHANEVVANDRLVEELWAEPPPSAANALQVYVGKLRRALEPERAKSAPHGVVVTATPGYRLVVGEDELDAGRFERLLAQGTRMRAAGDVAGALDSLRSALAMWRGPALAEFTYEPFAQAEIARLEELRIVACEERIAAQLALGSDADLAGELEALTRQHPLRERLRGQLMLALYRTGRQADALEVYRETHRLLVTDLGIEPSPELQELEAAILRQDAGLQPPPREAPPEGPPAPPQGRPPGPEPEPHPIAQERRKMVTIAVIRATAPASGLDPEALRGRQDRLREVVAERAEACGGTVAGELGDDAMVVFGIPLLHEDDHRRAGRAALDLRDRPADGRGADPLGPLAIGIASGEVLVGGDLDAPRIVGEATTTARRLSEAARGGEVLVSPETAALAGDDVVVEAAVAAPPRALRLVALAGEPPVLSEARRRPLVGREEELARLRQVFARAARTRTAHLFTVLGTAGIGKSRLAHELAELAVGEAMVLAGRCVPYGEGITFLPLGEMIRQLTASRPLAEVLAGVDDGDAIAERLATPARIAEIASSEEAFATVRRLFEALGREGPVLALFEDLHWAEPTFLDMIEYLAAQARECPLLLLCMARPELLEERPSWGGGAANSGSILLQPLPADCCEALVDALAPDLAGEARRRVLEAASGNPLFIEQIVASRGEGDLAARVDPPIPPSVQALVAARLDRLGPGERAVVERGAVVGAEFWAQSVAGLLPEEAHRHLEAHLDTLISKELLARTGSAAGGERALRFRHGLIQQVAYRAVPKEVRSDLHERLAASLQRRGESQAPEEDLELAGYHLEQAVRLRGEVGPLSAAQRELAGRAADSLASAGELAFRRGDMPASVSLLDRAASLLPVDDRRRVEVLPELGYALFEVGELERSRAVLAEAARRARACGEEALRWKAIVKRGQVQLCTQPEMADPGGIEGEVREAIARLSELGDDSGLAGALLLLSHVREMRGQTVAAQEAAERASEHALRAGNRREAAWALGECALHLLNGPTPVADALEWIERTSRESPSDPVLEAHLPAFVAALEAMTGQFERARERIARSGELVEALALTWQLGLIHRPLRASIEMLAGDAAAAERELRAAREAFAEVGDAWWVATVSADLPKPLYEQGRYDEAWALVEQIEAAPAPADSEWQIKRRGIKARLLARRGEPEPAGALAAKAVAIAADTDLVGFHADALMDLAEVRELAGDAAGARQSAAAARELYERKGNTVAAGRAAAAERLQPEGAATAT